MKTKKVKMLNKYHNTEIELRIPCDEKPDQWWTRVDLAWHSGRDSKARVMGNRIRRQLCGSAKCKCMKNAANLIFV